MDKPWPANAEKKQLIYLAHGLFIFLATAMRFIADEKRKDPWKRLDIVLQMLGHHKDSPLAYLYRLYDGIFAIIMDDPDPEMVEELKLVVWSVVLLQDQLSPLALDTLLGLRTGTAARNLASLHSVISLPQSSDGAIQIIHPSFPDFILSSKNPNLTINPPEHHAFLTKRCFEAMSGTLCKNICQITSDQISFPNKQILDLAARVRDHIPSHLRYALRNWAYHLSKSMVDEEILDLLKTFCEKQLLNWLEGLSLIDEMFIAVQALRIAQRTLQVCTTPVHKLKSLS